MSAPSELTGWQIAVLVAGVAWALLVAYGLWASRHTPLRYPQLQVNVIQPPKPAPNLTPDVVLTWEEAELIQAMLRGVRRDWTGVLERAMRRARGE